MGAKEQIVDYLSDHPEFRTSVGLYTPDRELLGKIEQAMEDLEIKVFCGKWCPDCRVQLPRFFSVVTALSREDFDLEIIEVNRRKKDEDGLAEMLEVMAIPTFIFIRDGVELGRIIERPRGRMEEDIADIILKS